MSDFSPEINPRFGAAFDRLDGFMAYRLVLVVAPSGYGKTACLRQWSRRLAIQPGTAVNPRPPFAWVNLENRDNDPHRFLSDLVAGLQQSYTACADLNGSFLRQNPVPAAASASPGFSLEDGIIDLLNLLVGCPQHFTLILDHYHLIQSAAVHAGMQLFLDYLPPQMHVILVSRSEPPLQLARFRARRQLLELGLQDFHPFYPE